MQRRVRERIQFPRPRIGRSLAPKTILRLPFCSRHRNAIVRGPAGRQAPLVEFSRNLSSERASRHVGAMLL